MAHCLLSQKEKPELEEKAHRSHVCPLLSCHKGTKSYLFKACLPVGDRQALAAEGPRVEHFLKIFIYLRAGGVAEKECPGRGLWGSLSVPLALSQGAGRLGEAQWYPGRCREPAGVGSFSSDPSHPPAAIRASF